VARRAGVSSSEGASGAGVRPAGLVAYAVFFVFAFPQRFGDTLVDGGLWLGPLAVASLSLAVSGCSPGRAAARAFVAGWIAHAAILYWIFVVTVRYGGASPTVGVLAVLALALYPAASTAAVGAVLGWLHRCGRSTPLAIAIAFVLGDYLRTFVATGFPWSLLGYTQSGESLWLPLARLGGVHLVGFGVALTGALIAGSVRAMGGRSGATRGLVGGAVAWLVLCGVGSSLEWNEAGRGAPSGPSVRVAVLQGSIEQGSKWSDARFVETLDRYATLTRVAAAEGAELVVWPETAFPGAIELEPGAAQRVAGLARELGVSLVVGAVGVAVDRRAGLITDWYDSAFVIEPDGRVAGRYDKSHLVPFGEYVPFRGLLGGFVEAIARGVAAGDVSPGPGPSALRVFVPDRAQGGGGAVRVGVPICYELLFPDLVRRFVADGAALLVAITNDAWYGRTGAPHQFLAITAMRAAETGVPLVRAANTGVSAIIDARGHVQHDSGLFERGLIVADVTLPGSDASTFYTRHGDVFVYGCWATLPLLLWSGLGLVLRARAGGTRGANGSSDRASAG